MANRRVEQPTEKELILSDIQEVLNDDPTHEITSLLGDVKEYIEREFEIRMRIMEGRRKSDEEVERLQRIFRELPEIKAPDFYELVFPPSKFLYGWQDERCPASLTDDWMTDGALELCHLEKGHTGAHRTRNDDLMWRDL